MAVVCRTCSYLGLPSHFTAALVVDGSTCLPFRTNLLGLRGRGYLSPRRYYRQLDGIETALEMQAFRWMGLRSRTHDTEG